MIYYIAIALCALFGAASFGMMRFKNLPAIRREAFWKSFYKKAYDILSSNFLARKSIRKISDKISMFSVFRRDRVNRLTVMYFLTAVGVSFIPIAVGFILFNNIFSYILTIVLAVVLYTAFVEKQFDKVYREILGSTAQFLSSLEIEYQKLRDIPAALLCIKAGDLSKVRDDIVRILTGTGSKQHKQEFFAAMPFRPLRTLAEVCYNINLYGDTFSENNGSNFISALSLIKADINAEIEKIELQKAKVGKIEYIPLIVAAAIAPLEMYLTYIIPSLSIVYNGLLGLILRSAALTIIICSYRLKPQSRPKKRNTKKHLGRLKPPS